MSLKDFRRRFTEQIQRCHTGLKDGGTLILNRVFSKYEGENNKNQHEQIFFFAFEIFLNLSRPWCITEVFSWDFSLSFSDATLFSWSLVCRFLLRTQEETRSFRRKLKSELVRTGLRGSRFWGKFRGVDHSSVLTDIFYFSDLKMMQMCDIEKKRLLL